MSKLMKVALGSVVFWLGLTILHAWLNLGFSPASLLSKKKEVAEETRFRVGFLPVT
ncbi:MAG TPA: hypothetical protein VN493_19165 [Thermoanaerobaculia bacterium]|nr:hypothetical protein [Thermoanaerobaculia bacterium]